MMVAELEESFWYFAMQHAVYVKNWMPHSSIEIISPFEKHHERTPSEMPWLLT